MLAVLTWHPALFNLPKQLSRFNDSLIPIDTNFFAVYRPFTCIMHPYTMIFKHFKQRAWYYDPEVHPAFRCIGTAKLPTAQGWGLAMKMCVRGCLALIRSHTEPDNSLFMCLWTPKNSSMGLEQAPPLLSCLRLHYETS